MFEFLQYARRGRNAWWRYLATLVLAFILMTIASVSLSSLAIGSGLAPPDFYAQVRNAAHPAWFYGYDTVANLALLLAFVLSALIIQNKSWRDILGRWRWDYLAVGAMVGLVVTIVGDLADFIVRPSGFRLILSPETAILALFAVPFSLTVTFFVEFIFHGYLAQGVLLASKRPALTAIIVGALSGLLDTSSWPHAAGAVVVGIVSTLIAIRTGGIAFTFGMNVVGGLIASIVLIDANDTLRGSPGIFSVSVPELAWFDVAVGVLLSAAIWLWVLRRYPATQPPSTADIFA